MAQPLPAGTISMNIIAPMEDSHKEVNVEAKKLRQKNAKKMEGNKYVVLPF